MRKVKSILTNPFLLGTQGFIAGALLLWSAPPPPRPADSPTAPAAQVQMVPPAS